MKNDLKLYVKNKKLNDKILFVNFEANMQKYYETADLLVSSSKWEGFSNVIAESLGHGLPVISTDCKSGPSEILKAGKYGKLVPIEDPKKLSIAIYQGLRKKHNKKLLIKRSLDFDVGKISEQYLELINYEK